jgi:hypothetical protein
MMEATQSLDGRVRCTKRWMTIEEIWVLASATSIHNGQMRLEKIPLEMFLKDFLI